MNITDLCFKLITIKNEREYHYAKYGEFIVIMIKSNDYTNGFINATKLCQLGNKQLSNWTKLDKSKELIEDFKKYLDRKDLNSYKFELNITGNKENNLLSGTYVHKKLILNISLWIFNEFYDKVSDIIENHLIKNFKDELSLNKNKLEELNIEIDKYNKIIEDKNNCITSLENAINNLTLSNKDLDKSNRDLNNKIETIKPKIITDPLNDNVYNILVLFKIDTNKYYISRIQYQNYKNSLRSIYKKYPNNEEILYLDKVPNSNYIFNRLKEEQNELGIEIKNNIITLIGGKENDLAFRLNELYNEKDFN